jgi:hypothetical protein
MTSTTNAPLVEAETTPRGGLRFWCGHCRGWHQHGAGYGHRVEHFWRPGSPYAGRGYILKEKKEPCT